MTKIHTADMVPMWTYNLTSACNNLFASGEGKISNVDNHVCAAFHVSDIDIWCCISYAIGIIESKSNMINFQIL